MTPDPKEMLERTSMDVARELLAQPALFSEFDGLPGLSPPTPTAVARYTGERSTSLQHDERNLKVGALRLLGASDREIEQACGVTRRTIPLILSALEKAGRITPLKDRLAMLTGDNAERANIALRQLLDQVKDDAGSVELASMIKAVGTVLGITTEKMLLLTGQATEIVETRVGAGREAYDAWWREVVVPVRPATLTEPPTESASPAAVVVSEQIMPPEAQRDGSDTSAQGGEAKRLDGAGGGPEAAGGPIGPTG